MSTAAQLAQYCVDHGFTLKQTQGTHMTSYLIPGTLTFDVILVALAYTVGRVGIPAFWADIKALYAKVRGVASPTPTAA